MTLLTMLNSSNLNLLDSTYAPFNRSRRLSWLWQQASQQVSQQASRQQCREGRERLVYLRISYQQRNLARCQEQ
jgi:hypothetical protein